MAICRNGSKLLYMSPGHRSMPTKEHARVMDLLRHRKHGTGACKCLDELLCSSNYITYTQAKVLTGRSYF